MLDGDDSALIASACPKPLFNPLTVPVDQLLTGWEILAGPYGLIAFIPLVPLVRLAARARPRSALIASGLVWAAATAGPVATLVLVAGCLVASSWVLLLGRLLASRLIGQRLMNVLLWLGLSALMLPAWWYPQWSWYGWGGGSRLALLHNIGLAYFYLRLIAWGVDLSHNPRQPLRAADTICWLLYPPCMRLGPVLLRREFLERLDAWQPASPPAWRKIGKRFTLFIAGIIALGVLASSTPVVQPGAANFFDSPQTYTTSQLLRVFYLIPIQIYILLWVYNELAAALSLWVGIPVDNNFDWLPLATSVRDFWRRWHITVGRWLRDYIYIPLGGNRGLVPLHYAAVFGFCALWHGASWSFVGWGASQALALSLQRWWDQIRRYLGWRSRPSGPWWALVSWLVTMHYQIATIIVFVDFDHLGRRLFGELGKRLLAGILG